MVCIYGLLQWVVAYMSSVEALATRIKIESSAFGGLIKGSR